MLKIRLKSKGSQILHGPKVAALWTETLNFELLRKVILDYL